MSKQNKQAQAQAQATAAATNVAERVRSNNREVRYQQRLAAALALRKAKHAQRITARAQAQYMREVQELAAKYNLPVPNTMSVRAYSTQQKHAPSAVQGACAQVHKIADQYRDRAATLAACKAAGINPATAATQYAKWKKLQQQEVEA